MVYAFEMRYMRAVDALAGAVPVGGGRPPRHRRARGPRCRASAMHPDSTVVQLAFSLRGSSNAVADLASDLQTHTRNGTKVNQKHRCAHHAIARTCGEMSAVVCVLHGARRASRVGVDPLLRTR